MYWASWATASYNLSPSDSYHHHWHRHYQQRYRKLEWTWFNQIIFLVNDESLLICSRWRVVPPHAACQSAESDQIIFVCMADNTYYIYDGRHRGTDKLNVHFESTINLSAGTRKLICENEWCSGCQMMEDVMKLRWNLNKISSHSFHYNTIQQIVK